jgi:FkbM family methyltransferase
MSGDGRNMKEALYTLVKAIVRELRYRNLRIPILNPPISRKIFQQLWRKEYERPEISAILSLLRDGDRVLELGSGLGIVSSVVAKSKPGIVVRSYEGNPDLLDFIARVHSMNGITNVEVRNEILLPNPAGPTMESLTHRSFAQSSIMAHGAVTKRVQVACSDINSVLSEFRPDVFVCDIEGGEELLFDGINLNGVRVVVIELHPTMISREAVKRLYDTCASAGLYPRVEHSTAAVVAFDRVDV